MLKHAVTALLALSAALPAFATRVLPGDTIFPNGRLTRDSGIFSNNRCFFLVLQNDGNLVIYKTSTGQPIWATGTHGIAVEQAAMQADGNFVLYQYNGSPVWASGTDGRDGSRIVMQDDGNLVIYTESFNRPVWASNSVTGCN